MTEFTRIQNKFEYHLEVYTTILRRFEYTVPRGLGLVNEENGRTREQEILEFCRVPRKSKEICNLLGKSTIPYLNRTYLQPLVESGKLLLTVPNYASNMQRYVNAENAGLIPTDGAILDYCKVPRTKTEIEQHFGLSHFMAVKHYNPLIESGKLIGNMPGLPRVVGKNLSPPVQAYS